MALQLSDNFKKNIENRDTSLIPIVRIYMPPEDIYLSTNSIYIDPPGAAPYNGHKPLLLNIPSLKESIDIEKKKYKINSVNIEISNAPYEGTRFSESFTESLTNRTCEIRWINPHARNYEDSVLIYQGYIRKYGHDHKAARLVLEDRSQSLVHRDLPLTNLGTDTNVPEKYKNKHMPMVYGYVDRSPVISDDNYISLKADSRDTIHFNNITNVYGTPESALYFYNNGFINVTEQGQIDFQSIPRIRIIKPPTATNQTMSQDGTSTLTESTFTLTCTDNTENYKIRLSNSINHPTLASDDFCDSEQLSGINWYSSDTMGKTNYVNITSPEQSFVVSPGAHHYEVLMASMEIDFTPAIAYDELTIREFVLNGQNLTNMIANGWGYTDSYSQTIKAYPIGWNREGTADTGTLPHGSAKDNISTTSTNYPYFNHILRTGGEYEDTFWGGWENYREKINNIFNWPKANILGYGNNSNADLEYNVDWSLSTPGAIHHEGDIILFYVGAEDRGLFIIDFRSILENSEATNQTATTAGLSIEGNFNNIGLLRNYNAIDFVFSEYDFFANVTGRQLIIDEDGNGLGQRDNAVNQLFDIIKNEIGYRKEESDLAVWEDHPSLITASQLLAGIGADDDNLGYKTDFTISDKINSKKLIENIASVTPFIIRFDNMGKLKFDIIPLSGGTVTQNPDGTPSENHTIKNSDIIDFSFSKTPIEDVKTKIEFKYHWNYANKEFNKELNIIDTSNNKRNYIEVRDIFPDYDPTGGFDTYRLNPNHSNSSLIIDDDRGKYIRDDATARMYALWLLSWHCNQHLKMKIKLPLKYLNLEVGDIVNFDSLLGGIKPYNKDYTVPNLLHGQIVYKNFIITSTNKTLDWVNVECMQLHYSYLDANLAQTTGCTDPNACNYKDHYTEDTFPSSCWYCPTGCEEEIWVDEGSNPIPGDDCCALLNTPNPPSLEIDPCGDCWLQGNSPITSSVVDCAGVCGGASVLDGCGICREEDDENWNATCGDCAGTPNGNAVICDGPLAGDYNSACCDGTCDDCGICNGVYFFSEGFYPTVGEGYPPGTPFGDAGLYPGNCDCYGTSFHSSQCGDNPPICGSNMIWNECDECTLWGAVDAWICPCSNQEVCDPAECVSGALPDSATQEEIAAFTAEYCPYIPVLTYSLRRGSNTFPFIGSETFPNVPFYQHTIESYDGSGTTINREIILTRDDFQLGGGVNGAVPGYEDKYCFLQDFTISFPIWENDTTYSNGLSTGNESNWMDTAYIFMEWVAIESTSNINEETAFTQGALLQGTDYDGLPAIALSDMQNYQYVAGDPAHVASYGLLDSYTGDSYLPFIALTEFELNNGSFTAFLRTTAHVTDTMGNTTYRNMNTEVKFGQWDEQQLGDVNYDGECNLLDLSNIVYAVTHGAFPPQEVFEGIPDNATPGLGEYWHWDVNCSGEADPGYPNMNVNDIVAFQTWLMSNSPNCPTDCLS